MCVSALLLVRQCIASCVPLHCYIVVCACIAIGVCASALKACVLYCGRVVCLCIAVRVSALLAVSLQRCVVSFASVV